MTPIVPRIAIFSQQPVELNLKTSNHASWIASDFEVHQFHNDVDINTLHNEGFSMIIAIGDRTVFKCLKDVYTIPVATVDSADQLSGDNVYNYYINHTLSDVNPTISIFTPAHNTFSKFDRALKSIQRQTYTNWEWVILDDSVGEDNYDYICKAVGNDHRIKVYKSNRPDGFVGSTKRQAASLCNGKYLLELDHDDELHDLALEACVRAFKAHPDAKFCYSNSAETFETGGGVRYGEGFGMHQGIHFPYTYEGKELIGADVPINASSIRHIVGVPNHFRCWERDFYFSIQRHNNKLAVVDDYELLVRTFLNTKMIQIQEVLYIQYMNAGGNNTQEPRRAEIQRLVDWIQKYYDMDIHKRILELGGIDWMWNDQTNTSELWRQPPNELKRSNLAYVFKL